MCLPSDIPLLEGGKRLRVNFAPKVQLKCENIMNISYYYYIQPLVAGVSIDSSKKMYS